jgi:CBS domain containing-hemolysin-like protein
VIHLWPVLFFLVMTALVAFFAGIETGLFSVSRAKVRNLAAGGDRRAVIASTLLERPDYFIGTALVGINIAHVILAVGTTWYFNRLLDNPAKSALAATLVITPVLLLFGEILPKAVFRLRPHATTLAAAGLFRFFYYLFYPITTLVLKISSFIAPRTGRSAEHEIQHRRDEILALVRHGEKTGVIEDDEKEMIESVFELAETVVREVMVPRVSMAAIAVDLPYQAMVAQVLAEGYTRFPVYQGTPDRIIGILHVADLLVEERFDRATLATPLYLSETMKVDDALEKLRAEGAHLAIVVDEYGGTAGLVTIEDLLEELVGEIEDEFDDAHAKVTRLEENRWSVDARADLGEFFEGLNVAFDDDEIESESVGGLVTERLGRIPRTGDAIEFNGFDFRVSAADERRVIRVEIERCEA